MMPTYSKSCLSCLLCTCQVCAACAHAWFCFGKSIFSSNKIGLAGRAYSRVLQQKLPRIGGWIASVLFPWPYPLASDPLGLPQVHFEAVYPKGVVENKSTVTMTVTQASVVSATRPISGNRKFPNVLFQQTLLLERRSQPFRNPHLFCKSQCA
jgi:hypothetical protein